jgi:hypothetical protein
MGTKIRPELSKKNKYWIPRHRYYELKHFCLQYPEWKEQYTNLSSVTTPKLTDRVFRNIGHHSDPTERCAERKIFYQCRIAMLEQVAVLTDKDLAKYILLAVTYGHSYTYLKTKLDIPCSKDTYYDRYRKFFWILSDLRD